MTVTKNKDNTRYYSEKQEKEVCKILNAYTTPNSGGGKFIKGDCINKKASLLCECKTCMAPKSSFSIKKEWLETLQKELFTNRLSNKCLAFSFGPEEPNYFIIDTKLMKYLVECLEKEEEF